MSNREMNAKKHTLRLPLAGRNFTSLLLGNLVYSISQWGMIIVIARLGNPIFVGQYSLGLAVTAPIILFLNLQLRNFQATDTNSQYEFHHYLKLRLVTMFIAYFVIVAIALWGYQNWDLFLVTLFIGLAKVFESISDIYFGLFQKHEHMNYISTSMILKGILSLVILSITMVLTNSIVLGSLSIAITWLMILLLYDLKNGYKLSTIIKKPIKLSSLFLIRTIDFKQLTKIAWLTIPLGIVSTLDSLNSNIPRYVLQNIGGEETVGYYAAISYFMIAGGTVVNAMLQSTSPKLASYYRLNLNKFKQLLIRLVCLSTGVGVIGILAAIVYGKQILNIMYGSNYAAHHQAFVYIMAASAVWYIASCLSIALTASRFIKVQVPIYILSCICVMITSLYFIPQYYLLGAAMSVCAGMITRAALTLACVFFSVRKQSNVDVISVPRSNF